LLLRRIRRTQLEYFPRRSLLAGDALGLRPLSTTAAVKQALHQLNLGGPHALLVSGLVVFAQLGWHYMRVASVGRGVLAYLVWK
jgi:hypothetical protein